MNYSDSSANSFAARAARYADVHQRFFSARVLDIVPYVQILAGTGLLNRVPLRVCDAFGGGGFVTSHLVKIIRECVVADASPEMLSNVEMKCGTRTVVVADDFASFSDVEAGTFDVVVAHGGLHHAVETANGTVDIRRSRERQQKIMGRLGDLLAPTGVLIVVDAANPSSSGAALSPPPMLSEEHIWEGLLDERDMRQLDAVVPRRFLRSYALYRPYVHEHIWAPVSARVPIEFFEDYVHNNCPGGHIALFPYLSDLCADLVSLGEYTVSALFEIPCPWLFNSNEDAAAFFYDAFALGPEAMRGRVLRNPAPILEILRRYLGVRRLNTGLVAVNWMVTVSCLQRQASLRNHFNDDV